MIPDNNRCVFSFSFPIFPNFSVSAFENKTLFLSLTLFLHSSISAKKKRVPLFSLRCYVLTFFFAVYLFFVLFCLRSSVDSYKLIHMTYICMCVFFSLFYFMCICLSIFIIYLIVFYFLITLEIRLIINAQQPRFFSFFFVFIRFFFCLV